MSEDFKPGTRPLLRLAGLDADRPFVSREDEGHAIWAVAGVLLMRLHLHPDPEARRAEDGPTDAQILASLRTALPEHFGDEGGGYIAWTLAAYGCRQKPTLASLHPWERLMFEWQDRRGSAPRIALMLRQAGFDSPLSPATLESIDRWISNPPSALGEASTIVSALFGRRLTLLDPAPDATEASFDELFVDLVAAVPPPPLRMSTVRLRTGATAAGPRWIVELEREGVVDVVPVPVEPGAMDEDGVATAVDTLLARLGRTERVFRLVPGRERGGDLLTMVLADTARFIQLANRLRLPILRGPDGMGPSITAGALVAVGEGRAARPASGPRSGPETVFPPSLLTGDTLTPMDAAFSGLHVASQPADGGMRSLISSLRRSFGAGRMLQAGKRANQSRVAPPAWMTDGADPLSAFYAQQETVFRKGRIVWGALVRANEALFVPGEADLPGVLVYSEDDYFDPRPGELRAIGARLAELRPGALEDPVLKDLADQLTRPTVRLRNVPVPSAITQRPVRVTSFMGVRSHMPGGRMAGEWFPVLAHAGSAYPMLVPGAFWSTALREAWDAGKLHSLAAPRAA